MARVFCVHRPMPSYYVCTREMQREPMKHIHLCVSEIYDNLRWLELRGRVVDAESCNEFLSKYVSVCVRVYACCLSYHSLQVAFDVGPSWRTVGATSL